MRGGTEIIIVKIIVTVFNAFGLMLASFFLSLAGMYVRKKISGFEMSLKEMIRFAAGCGIMAFIYYVAATIVEAIRFMSN